MKPGRLLFIELVLFGSLVACTQKSSVGIPNSTAKSLISLSDSAIGSRSDGKMGADSNVPGQEDEDKQVLPADSARWKEEMRRKQYLEEQLGKVAVPPKSEAERLRRIREDSLEKAKIRQQPKQGWKGVATLPEDNLNGK